MYKTEEGLFPTVTDHAILGFFGEFRFLSNFHSAVLEVDGLTFMNSEAAYMAQKSVDPLVREQFLFLNGSEAKRLGRKIEIRSDWDSYRKLAMYKVLCAKFCQNEELANALLATGYKYLEETNTWKDTYWGVCNGVGENWLGWTLMRIRYELRHGVLVVNDLHPTY
jgi:hypothetical protein